MAITLNGLGNRLGQMLTGAPPAASNSNAGLAPPAQGGRKDGTNFSPEMQQMGAPQGTSGNSMVNGLWTAQVVQALQQVQASQQSGGDSAGALSQLQEIYAMAKEQGAQLPPQVEAMVKSLLGGDAAQQGQQNRSGGAPQGGGAAAPSGGGGGSPSGGGAAPSGGSGEAPSGGGASAPQRSAPQASAPSEPQSAPQASAPTETQSTPAPQPTAPVESAPATPAPATEPTAPQTSAPPTTPDAPAITPPQVTHAPAQGAWNRGLESALDASLVQEPRGFRDPQAWSQDGANNCANVGVIKGAMAVSGNGLFDSVVKTDDGYTVTRQNGTTVSVTQEELGQAADAARLKGRTTGEATPGDQASQAMAILATSVMAKDYMQHPDDPSHPASSYQDALTRVNSPRNPSFAANNLGIPSQIVAPDAALSQVREGGGAKAAVLYNGTHAEVAVPGQNGTPTCDVYGTSTSAACTAPISGDPATRALVLSPRQKAPGGPAPGASTTTTTRTSTTPPAARETPGATAPKAAAPAARPAAAKPAATKTTAAPTKTTHKTTSKSHKD